MHWEKLKDGARQNFMVLPKPNIQPNAPMDNDMINTAVAFIDELIELGVVKTPEEGYKILCNAPIFAVPKEH